MKKHIIILLGALVISSVAYSQVGINTEAPKATLDVVASPDEPELIDGFIAPRLEGNELSAKDALYTTEQAGTIIYAKSAATPTTDKTINVTSEGYYYFDGTLWVKMGTGSTTAEGAEPWFIQNTSDEATANDDNIYQQGKVAVGFTDADAVSDKQLDVKGDFRTLTEVGGRYTGIETNFAGAGFTFIFNSDDIDNLIDADGTSFYVGQDMVGSAAKTSNNRATSMLAPSMIEHSVGTMDLTNMVSNFYMTESSIVFKTQEGGAVDNINRTSLMLGNGTNDIKFVYSDGSGNLTGAYTFPKTAGNVGQVLGVATRMGNTNTLQWKTLSEVPLDGVTLKSPGGSCFSVTVNDAGVLATTAVACP